MALYQTIAYLAILENIYMNLNVEIVVQMDGGLIQLINHAIYVLLSALLVNLFLFRKSINLLIYFV